jgi:4,5-DOPA dioxygenase extradiol
MDHPAKPEVLMSLMPSIFISHGAPTVAIDNSEARAFLEGFGASLGRPAAIVVVSAHWEVTGSVLVTGAARPDTIHDFGPFDRRLDAMRYPAPGAPDIAETIATGLVRSGFRAAVDPRRGYDHGAWIPLKLMYPEADVPVVEVSIDPTLGPDHHLRLGEALAPLREQNVLVIGSGSLTHNLHEFRGHAPDDAAPDWVLRFGDWIAEAIVSGRREDLVRYRALAPAAERNHPTDEHLLPLFAAIGAAGHGLNGTRVHHSHSYGVISMDAYAFH